MSWPYKRRRHWMLLALLVLIPIILSTAFWFIPQALDLMRDAGTGLTPAQITARAQAWLFWDKVRFVGLLAVFVLTLMALLAPPLRTQSPSDDQTA